MYLCVWGGVVRVEVRGQQWAPSSSFKFNRHTPPSLASLQILFKTFWYYYCWGWDICHCACVEDGEPLCRVRFLLLLLQGFWGKPGCQACMAKIYPLGHFSGLPNVLMISIFSIFASTVLAYFYDTDMSPFCGFCHFKEILFFCLDSQEKLVPDCSLCTPS